MRFSADDLARLTAAGVRRIEVASFVSPSRVPQMADGAAVLAGSAVLERDGRRMARGYPPLSFGKRRPGDDFR